MKSRLPVTSSMKILSSESIDDPIIKKGLVKEKNDLINTTYKAILRNIEKETREFEGEIMRETMTEIQKRGRNLPKEELEKVMNSARTKVYKRPMTAVNAYKQKQTGTIIIQRQKQEETEEDTEVEMLQANNPVASKPMQEHKVEDDEMYVKQKITLDEPMPVNIVSLHF